MTASRCRPARCASRPVANSDSADATEHHTIASATTTTRMPPSLFTRTPPRSVTSEYLPAAAYVRHAETRDRVVAHSRSLDTGLRANATPRYRLLAPGRQLYHPGPHQPLQAADEAGRGEFLRGEGLNQNGLEAEKVGAKYVGEHLMADERGAWRLRAHQHHRRPKPLGNGFRRRGDNRHVRRTADGLRTG